MRADAPKHRQADCAEPSSTPPSFPSFRSQATAMNSSNIRSTYSAF
ncbi:MAG: hypothetical protein JWQ11_3667, partial [Rhizobacter sp.]|nr:hypothetical protein [Rhizobacter sp.]